MSVLGWCSTAICLLTMATVAQLATAQTGNVALGKPAESSSLLDPSMPASVAVDGVTDNVGQCVDTAQIDRNPYWRVDLGQSHTVQYVTVFWQRHRTERMQGVKIYVDSELCHSISRYEAYTPPLLVGPIVSISVRCSTPLTGRHVTLVKNYTGIIDIDHPEVLSVCEVQVWATASSPSSRTTSTTTTATAGTTTTTTTTAAPTPRPTPRSLVTVPTASTTTTTTITTTTTTTITTLTTALGDNGGSTSVSEDRSASPPETATTAGIVGVVGGVLGSLLLISLTVIVVLVVRTMRRREQKRGDNRQPDGGDTDTDTAGAGPINTATLPSVAEGAAYKGTQSVQQKMIMSS